MIRAHIINHFRGTSIKGVPRAVKAESHFRRCFWILVVVIQFLAAALTVWYLLSNYFNYPVVTIWKGKSLIMF